MVIANKQGQSHSPDFRFLFVDHPDALPVLEIAQRMGLNVDNYHWNIAPVSTTSGEGIYDALDWFFQTIWMKETGLMDWISDLFGRDDWHATLYAVFQFIVLRHSMFAGREIFWITSGTETLPSHDLEYVACHELFWRWLFFQRKIRILQIRRLVYSFGARKSHPVNRWSDTRMETERNRRIHARFCVSEAARINKLSHSRSGGNSHAEGRGEHEG